MIHSCFKQYVFLIFCLPSFYLASQNPSLKSKLSITGKVYQKDSLNTVPFAYVLNKNSGTGVVANIDASFAISGKYTDTLIVSYLGYHTQYISINGYADSVKNNMLLIRIYLSLKNFDLPAVQIMQNDFTENEKQYYGRIYNRPKASIESPISLLYERYSKRGKSLIKLDSLYKALLDEEYINFRLNDAILQNLTGNPKITLKEFRRRCYVPDYFILSAGDYDLYETVNRCYQTNWKFENGK